MTLRWGCALLQAMLQVPAELTGPGYAALHNAAVAAAVADEALIQQLCLQALRGVCPGRVSFAPLFQRAATMKQFMWQPDLMRVAQFLHVGVEDVGK